MPCDNAVPLQDIGDNCNRQFCSRVPGQYAYTVSDMNNDITVAARSMGDSPHQHRVVGYFAVLLYGSHSIMNEQNRRRHR